MNELDSRGVAVEVAQLTSQVCRTQGELEPWTNASLVASLR